MTSLDISDNRIGQLGQTEGTVALADAIQNHEALVHLNIRRNGLGSKGLRTLAPALHNSNVTALNLAANYLTNPMDRSGRNDDMRGVKAFAEGLGANAALTSLDIGSNKLGHLVIPAGWRSRDGDGAAPWVHDDGRMLGSGVPAGSRPEGAIAIANAIRTSKTLTRLDLRSNCLTNSGHVISGVRALAAAIPPCRYVALVRRAWSQFAFAVRSPHSPPPGR